MKNPLSDNLKIIGFLTVFLGFPAVSQDPGPTNMGAILILLNGMQNLPLLPTAPPCTSTASIEKEKLDRISA